MAYIKTVWTDFVSQFSARYKLKDINNGNEIATYDLEQVAGEVLSEGTPLTAQNLNKIEQGIYDLDQNKADKSNTLWKRPTVNLNGGSLLAYIKTQMSNGIFFGNCAVYNGSDLTIGACYVTWEADTVVSGLVMVKFECVSDGYLYYRYFDFRNDAWSIDIRRLIADDYLNTQLATKAPTNHASANATYGVGTASLFGHVKLWDGLRSPSDATQGVAATPSAVNQLDNKIQANPYNYTLLKTITLPTTLTNNMLINILDAFNGMLYKAIRIELTISNYTYTADHLSPNPTKYIGFGKYVSTGEGYYGNVDFFKIQSSYYGDTASKVINSTKTISIVREFLRDDYLRMISNTPSSDVQSILFSQGYGKVGFYDVNGYSVTVLAPTEYGVSAKLTNVVGNIKVYVKEG